MMRVSEHELNIITDILSKYAPEFDVLAFGSRYNQTSKRYSDLDLAFRGNDKLDMKKRSQLICAFSESDLPYRVDVVDYNAVSPEFQAVINMGNEKIFSGKKGKLQ